MRIALLPGLRFNGSQVSSSLKKLMLDVDVFTSSRFKQWSHLNRSNYHFIPMPFTVIQRTTGIMRKTWMKEFDARFFDKCSRSSLGKKAAVVHGWATFSLESGKRAKRNGGFYFLDRACPHIEFQNQLLDEEASHLGMTFTKSSNAFVDRALEEYDACDKIVLPSDYSLNSFLSRGFPKEKLIKAPLSSNFQPKLIGTYNSKPKDALFVVGFVGGNILRKGLIYLIHAWQNLKLNNAVLKLKISQKELERIPHLLSKINSDPSIEIIGYIQDMETFYRQCDVFCLPSIDDGFGMVVFEAMGCGVPVIASKNAGATEMLSNQHCSDVVEPRNAVQITEAIYKYYADRELLENAKKEAATFFEKVTAVDYHFNAMKDLYKDVIDDHIK